MQSSWLKDAKNTEERKELEKTLRNSRFALDILAKMVYNISKDIEKSKFDDYDSPSWAYSQADKNGQLRAYRRILDLLDFSSKGDRPQ